LENLETKVTGIATTKSGLQDIEKRFEAINTSISYINKSIDEGINISLKAQAESLVKVKTDIAEIKAQVKALDKEIDRLEARLLKNNDNPLAQ